MRRISDDAHVDMVHNLAVAGPDFRRAYPVDTEDSIRIENAGFGSVFGEPLWRAAGPSLSSAAVSGFVGSVLPIIAAFEAMFVSFEMDFTKNPLAAQIARII